MNSNSIFYSGAFQSSLLATGAFLFSLLIANVVIYQTVQYAMYAALEEQLIEEVVLFEDIAKREGLAGLKVAIQKLEQTLVPDSKKFKLIGPQGERLAGGLNVVPDFVGFSTAPIQLPTQKEVSRFYLHSAKINDATLVIGRNLRDITSVLKKLTIAMVIAMISVVLLTLLAGYWVGAQISRRLAGLVNTLDEISSGDTKIRIPVDESKSQINLISLLINEQLDRLSVLMESTQNVSRAIAHDLRTPLNRASLILQEASDPNLPKQQCAILVGEASAEIDNITATFDTMLRIARIESSSDKTPFSEVDIIQLVDDVVETYQPVFMENQQELSAEIQKSELLFCDGRMIKQLLANLLENTLRYCPAGSRISVCGSIGPQGNFVLSVTDNGPGIPVDRYSEVLQPFTRLDASRKDQGAGLGLALVKAVAVRHGALLELDNNRPGLIVRIVFPQRKN